MNPRTLIALSGLSWLVIGIMLLSKGLRLIAEAMTQTNSFIFQMRDFFGSRDQGAVFLIAIALIIGLLKGRLVLSKTVARVSNRIHSLPLPIQLKDVYSRSYLLLLGSMILLGMTFRFLPIPIDLRGAINVAIGSALINGAMLFFRTILSFKKSHL